jgi:hypothetical protein
VWGNTELAPTGRPLELDTDGIWCTLPATFPENVSFTFALDPTNPRDAGKKATYVWVLCGRRMRVCLTYRGPW